MSSITFPPSPISTPPRKALQKTPASASSSSPSTHTTIPSTPTPTPTPTRTIAILSKACAKVHRLSIESKIVAAGFEILVYRLEEWSYPDDVDFLYELLAGHSDGTVRYWIAHLTGAPIYFMVLERVRAVETWLDLIGPGEAEEEEQEGEEGEESLERSFTSTSSIKSPTTSSNSSSARGLRAIYGKGCIYGSINGRQAERQIAVCAPELASEEALNDLHASFAYEEAEASVDDEVIQTAHEEGCILLREAELVYNETGQAFRATTGEEVDLQEEVRVYGANEEVMTNACGDYDGGDSSLEEKPIAPSVKAKEATRQEQQKIFKARPVPASLAKPSMEPRLTRAAALRMGVELPSVSTRSVKSETPSSSGLVGISGLPKAEVPLPKSLAEPTIKPRANRASLARAGLVEAPPSIYQRPRKEVDFSNTPGHRRISVVGNVASLAQPTIAPRQNRASLARLGAVSMPAHAKIPVRRTLSVTSADSAAAAAASVAGIGSATDLGENRRGVRREALLERKPVDFSNTPGHRRTLGPSNLASLKPPAIPPRTNKAAAARGGIVAGSVGPSSLGNVHSSPPRSSTSLRASIAASDASGRSSPSKPTRTASSAALFHPTPQTRERKPVDFSNTPGHKKTASFQIASLAAPKIPPKLNNAASKRMSVGGVVGDLERMEFDGRASPTRPGTALAGRSPSRTGTKTMVGSTRPASSAGVRNVGLHPAPHQDLEMAKRSSDPRFKGNSTDGSGSSAPPKARGAPPSAYRAPSTQIV